MDSQIVSPIILFFQTYFSSELYTVVYLIFSGILLLISQRLFGLVGLFGFNAINLLACNIQVLGLTQFSLYPEPVALGIVTFTMIFLTIDIISEHYGEANAKLGIWLGLFLQIIFMLLMLGGMGYSHYNFETESAIQHIFVPNLRIVLASLIAYLISQYINLFIFQILSKFNHLSKSKYDSKSDSKSYLWARTLSSVAIAGFLDLWIFGLLAWKLLSPNPVTWRQLLLSYIFINYMMRFITQILSVPIIYLSYYCKPKSEI